jgi:hypothetical protein
MGNTMVEVCFLSARCALHRFSSRATKGRHAESRCFQNLRKLESLVNRMHEQYVSSLFY